MVPIRYQGAENTDSSASESTSPEATSPEAAPTDTQLPRTLSTTPDEVVVSVMRQNCPGVDDRRWDCLMQIWGSMCVISLGHGIYQVHRSNILR